ncbi:IscA/HesB family protein [Desulfogranum mediterraneum]|uniref:IscA/HesB family protein n=1 Tax=Desulfogranum mediterraneum TaxID=160661 RepID=UPI0004277256|nr:IscA/HesB family protein [Desulfogranum mediterraneum]
MFEITPSALENLSAYLKDNNTESAIRVAAMQGGCSGPTLGLALDQISDNDQVFTEGQLQFLVEKELLAACGTIKVEFIEAGSRSGFAISSTHPLPGGGCSSCAGGSCG